MQTFFCVACRFTYPIEKAAHLATAVHRDGEPVGFCFLCVREIQRDVQVHAADDVDIAVEADEQAANA